MKARITFDFAKLFLQKEEYLEDELIVSINEEELEIMEKGDIVEILKVVESDKFPNGKGYVVYNPKNHSSSTVTYHDLDFEEIQN